MNQKQIMRALTDGALYAETDWYLAGRMCLPAIERHADKETTQAAQKLADKGWVVLGGNWIFLSDAYWDQYLKTDQAKKIILEYITRKYEDECREYRWHQKAYQEYQRFRLANRLGKAHTDNKAAHFTHCRLDPHADFVFLPYVWWDDRDRECTYTISDHSLASAIETESNIQYWERVAVCIENGIDPRKA